MKCPKCKGCGMMDVDDGIFTIHGYDCDYCLGTGYIEPITNEEYIRSCSVEELAGIIYEWHTKGYARGKNGLKLDSITTVVEWLKQPHTIKE